MHGNEAAIDAYLDYCDECAKLDEEYQAMLDKENGGKENKGGKSNERKFNDN